jgi:FAD:protein FMN transferase
MNRIIKIMLLLVVTVHLTACRQEPYRECRMQLGTIINLTILGETEKKASELANGVFTGIDSVERLMSPYREGSDVYRINRHAADKSVTVSPDTLEVIRESIAVADETYGCFDITFASLSHLWRLNDPDFHPPAPLEVARLLDRVNYRNVRLDVDQRTVRLTKSGVKIGLGGIAKGYAVRRGIAYLKANGARHAIVAAAGDLQVMGSNHGEPWAAGLMHPRKKAIIMSITLSDGDAISTSGDYERVAFHGGTRYHHIMDPRTGYPAKTFSSVSVISKDPVHSDAYSTAIFVMGMERARELLKKKKGLSVILIDLDMKIYASRELKERIKMIEKGEVGWM